MLFGFEVGNVLKQEISADRNFMEKIKAAHINLVNIGYHVLVVSILLIDSRIAVAIG